MSETVTDPPVVDAPAEAVAIDCPPPAARPPEVADDPRAALLELARTLARTPDHRLLVEYLRLRRSLR